MGGWLVGSSVGYGEEEEKDEETKKTKYQERAEGPIRISTNFLVVRPTEILKSFQIVQRL